MDREERGEGKMPVARAAWLICVATLIALAPPSTAGVSMRNQEAPEVKQSLEALRQVAGAIGDVPNADAARSIAAARRKFSAGARARGRGGLTQEDVLGYGLGFLLTRLAFLSKWSDKGEAFKNEALEGLAAIQSAPLIKGSSRAEVLARARRMVADGSGSPQERFDLVWGVVTSLVRAASAQPR